MGSRGRWLLVLAPVAVTVLLAAVVGVFIIVQNQQQADQVEQADQVAADYLSDVATFRASVRSAIIRDGVTEPSEIREALVEAVEDPPVLPDADSFGMQTSTAYAEAEEIASGLLGPYQELDTTLAEATVSVRWVKAAREALGIRVTDFVDSTTLSSSGPLRNSLVPGVAAARDALEQVPVPPGQEDLDDTVESALQYLIDQATLLADSIDRQQNYSFTYDAQFRVALTAVEDYATEVRGDVTEEINAVADLGR